MAPPLRQWAVVAVGAALFAAPACALAAGAAPARLYTVVIQQLMFGPLPTTLQVGDSIEWVNDDIFTHSATAVDKSFDVELQPKAHVKMKLAKAGTFAFFCRYHPGMMGKLVVRPRK